MTERFNEPNWAYLCAMKNDNGEDIGDFVIEQKIATLGSRRNLDRIDNAVSQRLHEYYVYLGIRAYVVWSGPIEDLPRVKKDREARHEPTF